MQHYSTSPHEMVASFWRNRGLIFTLTKREITARYRGSFLGMLWSFFNPVFMLIIYTFVFGVIFNSRWSHGSEPKTEYAIVLFAGLIMFNLFSECVNRAPGLVLWNTSYVKRVIFPLEILPWVALGAAIFNWLVSFIVWFIFYGIFFGIPHITALLLPVTMIPFLLIILGLTWWLASLGVYLRDVSQIIGIIVTALMFVAPIFYPITSISENYRYLLYLNPLTLVIEEARDVIFWGNVPDVGGFLIYLACGLLIAWLGFAWFQRTRKGFADVI